MTDLQTTRENLMAQAHELEGFARKLRQAAALLAGDPRNGAAPRPASAPAKPPIPRKDQVIAFMRKNGAMPFSELRKRLNMPLGSLKGALRKHPLIFTRDAKGNWMMIEAKARGKVSEHQKREQAAAS